MIIPYRDENPSISFPTFTITLIALNVILFYLSSMMGGIKVVANNFGFMPNALIDRPWVILSSILLHANFIHLIGNMWFLWLFGDNIEDRFGRINFLILFVLAGIAGNFTHAAFNLFRSDMPVVGASGAIAGIMGSYMVRFPKARIRCIFFIIFYPIFFRLSAVWFIGGWLIWEFILAFLSAGDNVAHWAHIGGFVFGFIWAYGRNDKFPFPRGVWGFRH